MKLNRIAIIAMLTLVVGVLKSQMVTNYGLKLSLTSSNIEIRDKKPYRNYGYLSYIEGEYINPSIGLFSDFKIFEDIYLETELAYIQKGASQTNDITYTSIDNPDEKKSQFTALLSLQYLEFRVGIKPTVQFGNIPTYIIVGSSFNYLLQASSLMRAEVEDYTYGYQLGAGINIANLINSPVFIELKYSGDYSAFHTTAYGNLWNRLFIFTIGTNL